VFLVHNIEQNVPDFMVTDPARLKQILINLLKNSTKFVLEGFVQLVVRTTTMKTGSEQSQEAIQFEIYDTGIGIS
jgi:two-component system, sensor histidine kinase and response regulator